MTCPETQGGHVTSRGRHKALVSYHYEEELQDEHRIVISVDLLRELSIVAPETANQTPTRVSIIAPDITNQTPTRVSVQFAGKENIHSSNGRHRCKPRSNSGENESDEETEEGTAVIERDYQLPCTGHHRGETDPALELAKQNTISLQLDHTRRSKCHSSNVTEDKTNLEKTKSFIYKPSQKSTYLNSLRNRQLENDQKKHDCPLIANNHTDTGRAKIKSTNRMLPCKLTDPHKSNEHPQNNHVIRSTTRVNQSNVDDRYIGLIGAEVRRIPSKKRYFCLPLVSGNKSVLHEKEADSDSNNSASVRRSPRAQTASTSPRRRRVNFIENGRNLQRGETIDCIYPPPAHDRDHNGDGKIGSKMSVSKTSVVRRSSTPLRDRLPYKGTLVDRRITSNKLLNHRGIHYTPRPELQRLHNLVTSQNSTYRGYQEKPKHREILEDPTIHSSPIVEIYTAPALPPSRTSSPTEYITTWLQQSGSTNFTHRH